LRNRNITSLLHRSATAQTPENARVRAGGLRRGSFYDPPMVPEAPLEQTEDGLLPAGEDFLVLQTRYRDGWLSG
jgi:hypothetical protein